MRGMWVEHSGLVSEDSDDGAVIILNWSVRTPAIEQSEDTDHGPNLLIYIRKA